MRGMSIVDQVRGQGAGMIPRSAGFLVLAAFFPLTLSLVVSCRQGSEVPAKREELRQVEYTPPDIPLVRRKQVFREVQKLIHDYEEKSRAIRQEFAEGKMSSRERDLLLKEAAERHEFELKAILGRYGLRLKDLPHILAEARDKGWD